MWLKTPWSIPVLLQKKTPHTSLSGFWWAHRRECCLPWFIRLQSEAQLLSIQETGDTPVAHSTPHYALVLVLKADIGVKMVATFMTIPVEILSLLIIVQVWEDGHTSPGLIKRKVLSIGLKLFHFLVHACTW